MPRIDASVMLVGSVPLGTAERVFSTCAGQVGDHVATLPDGETGYRKNWITYQGYFVHHANPMLETLVRPAPVDGIQQWAASNFSEMWTFKVRPGIDEVEFGDLYYATEAAKSYVAFSDLKQVGAIPADVRFQVSLPSPHGATSGFFRADPDDLGRVLPGYERALAREVAAIVDRIPADDLAIQWDVCTEVVEIEGGLPWLPQDGRAWERYLDTLRAVGVMVPEEVLMGLHLCYGDNDGEHFLQPRDLGTVTRMANTAVELLERPVDWLHMPVPIDRSDDAYFAPLEDLQAADSKLFLGLLHPSDGVDGARRRVEAAKRHTVAPFGVSTECGLGRRPPETIEQLLTLHRDVADELGT